MNQRITGPGPARQDQSLSLATTMTYKRCSERPVAAPKECVRPGSQVIQDLPGAAIHTAQEARSQPLRAAPEGLGRVAGGSRLSLNKKLASCVVDSSRFEMCTLEGDRVVERA